MFKRLKKRRKIKYSTFPKAPASPSELNSEDSEWPLYEAFILLGSDEIFQSLDNMIQSKNALSLKYWTHKLKGLNNYVIRIKKKNPKKPRKESDRLKNLPYKQKLLQLLL